MLALCAGCQKAHDTNTVATVNGKPIQRSEVETIFQNNLGESHQTPSTIQAQIMRLKIVRQLIDEEIVMQRAAKQNLVATDEEVADRLNEIKAPFTQEEFQKRLDSQHLTLDDLKREIRRNRTEEKLFNKEITSRINITDGDIASYYNEHKADFNLIEPNYHLAQIIVTAAPMPPQQVGNLQNSKAMNEADAKRKIDMLHNRLESGEDFGALAMNFSENPNTAGSGGDMGFVSESQLRGDPDVYARHREAEAGTDHGCFAGVRRAEFQAGGWLRDLQADRPRSSGTASVERSTGTAGDPAAAARQPRRAAQECVSGNAARPGAGGELLRRRSLPERGAVRQ